MKAYRNIAGVVREIQVDIGLNGQPILPPDTTVDVRPEPLEGHYVTVVDNAWVQIEIPVYTESFEVKQNRVVESIYAYRAWYFNQPITYNEVVFDADEQARHRLTQALVMHSELAYLPPLWVTHDNGSFAIDSIETLRGIAGAASQAFSQRFYECNELRTQALAATDEESLNAVIVPSIPTAL